MAKTFKQFIFEAKSSEPTHTVRITHNIWGHEKVYHVSAKDDQSAVNTAIKLHKKQFPKTDEDNQNEKTLTKRASVLSHQDWKSTQPTYTHKVTFNYKHLNKPVSSTHNVVAKDSEDAFKKALKKHRMYFPLTRFPEHSLKELKSSSQVEEVPRSDTK